MQPYELLCILPGTLAETEVAGAEARVKSVIEEKGGKIQSFEDMGKNRLAYPIKHIRYGYFRVCRFEADRQQVSVIEQKLRLQEGVLRVLIQARDLKQPTPSVINFIAPTNRDMGDSASVEAIQPVSPVREVESKGSAPVAAPVEEKKASLEDIDKKLNELIDKDITSEL